jgi:hypothetical protein
MDKLGLRLFIINLHWCGHVLGPSAFASSNI